eukprot:SAG31_NODE_5017_length_2799_cov_2.853333_1_plen_227_part_00
MDERQLREELAALRPRALQRKAEHAGGNDEDLENAEDTRAIIDLIVAKMCRPQETEHAAESLSLDEADAIAYFLLSKRERGELVHDVAALPALESIADAYSIHRGLTKTQSTLGPQLGWKIGAFARGRMAELGLDEPFCAPLFQDRVRTEVGLDAAIGGGHLLMVEAGFGFVLKKALPPRRPAAGGKYTPMEAWSAVDLVVPTLEVCTTRWTGPYAHTPSHRRQEI